MGGRSDQAHHVEAVSGKDLGKLDLFLVRHVGKNHASQTHLTLPRSKMVDAVAEHHVGIRHDDERNVAAVRTEATDHVEHVVRGDAVLESTDVGVLDNRTLRRGIREGNAQLDEVCAGISHSYHQALGHLKCGVSRGNEGDERLSVGALRKCVLDATHEGPPRDSVR